MALSPAAPGVPSPARSHAGRASVTPGCARHLGVDQWPTGGRRDAASPAHFVNFCFPVKKTKTNDYRLLRLKYYFDKREAQWTQEDCSSETHFPSSPLKVVRNGSGRQCPQWQNAAQAGKGQCACAVAGPGRAGVGGARWGDGLVVGAESEGLGINNACWCQQCFAVFEFSFLTRHDWGNWASTEDRREGGDLSNGYEYLRGAWGESLDPGSACWCPATGQETTDRNWCTGSSTWI